jgi:hypothetical protein
MATRKNLQRAYGFGQGIYDLSPKPIVAQRAPTTSDFAEIGTIWVDQDGLVSYTLIEVAGNQATWGNQAQIGALVTDLTVNPGPLELLSNTDAARRFFVDLNGGAAETAEILVEQGTGVAAISLGASVGGITLNGGLANATAINLTASDVAGGMTLTAGTAGIIETSTGTISLASSQAAANTINLNASDAAGSVRIQSAGDLASAIDLQASAGGINLAAAGAAGQDIQIINTGGSVTIRATEADANAIVIQATGAGAAGVQISTDANVTAVNLGTGAAAKTVVVGSTNTTSTTTIQSGTGGIALATGAIAANAGSVSVAPLTATVASPTAAATMDRRVGRATFTGFTTASAASQVFTITNATVIANSGIFVTAQNAGGNDAQMTITRVKPAVGSFEVTLRNDGAAALNGDVIITFWVIS